MKTQPGGVMLGGATAMWHPWKDKPGLRHIPTRWHEGSILSDMGVLSYPANAEECIQYVGRNQLYLFCNDILDAREIAFSKELVKHEKTEPYMQRTGKICALRVHPARTSGFFIPASTWLYSLRPSSEFVESVRIVFARFGYEAITPASLSEKVLRSTLPERIAIYRPAAPLRRILLENNGGGRIDVAEIGVFYPCAYTYDLNKAYLSFSRLVPDPVTRPIYHYRPGLNELWQYPTGYYHVTMTAHGTGVQPIYLNVGSVEHPRMKKPVEGQTFCKWLWRGEIADCLEAGYTVEHIHRGYSFPKMSDFMSPWVDILWESMQHDDGELAQSIKKSMAVGLPGRFLKQPESYKLIPIGQQKNGDTPITTNWYEGCESYFTDFYVRAEYNLESTSLTPIGAYIVAECRRAIYHAQVEEIKRGNTALRSYIDSVTFAQPATSLDVGAGLGNFKEKIHVPYLAQQNATVGCNPQTGDDEMTFPGQPLGSDARLRLWQKYRKLQGNEL